MHSWGKDTRLWERAPDRMGDAVARHDRILRDFATGRGGYVFATGGDGFAVAFQRAGEAIGSSLYDFADTTCSGPITAWAAAERLPAGSATSHLDWRWQHVEVDRTVTSQDDHRCFGCHIDCGVPPDGYPC